MQLNKTPNRNKNKINTFLFTLEQASRPNLERWRERESRLGRGSDSVTLGCVSGMSQTMGRVFSQLTPSFALSLSFTPLFSEEHSMQIARRTATKGLSSDLNLWLLTQYLPGSPSTDQAHVYQEYFGLGRVLDIPFYFPCKSPARNQLKTRT